MIYRNGLSYTVAQRVESENCLTVQDPNAATKYRRLLLHWLASLTVSLKGTAAYFSQHPLKFKAAEKGIVMLPLILFCDDTSGNKLKKWHKFESWYLSLAGLPRSHNTRPENIHFVCCSDKVSPIIDLGRPIAQKLTMLETEGICVFDALHN